MDFSIKIVIFKGSAKFPVGANITQGITHPLHPQYIRIY